MGKHVKMVKFYQINLARSSQKYSIIHFDRLGWGVSHCLQIIRRKFTSQRGLDIPQIISRRTLYLFAIAQRLLLASFWWSLELNLLDFAWKVCSWPQKTVIYGQRVSEQRPGDICKIDSEYLWKEQSLSQATETIPARLGRMVSFSRQTEDLRTF